MAVCEFRMPQYGKLFLMAWKWPKEQGSFMYAWVTVCVNCFEKWSENGWRTKTLCVVAMCVNVEQVKYLKMTV